MKSFGRFLAIKIAAFAACICLAATGAAGQARSGVRSITVQTEPKAVVSIDGVNYGTASESGSLKIATVPNGRKTIRVRADGFKETRKPLLPVQSGEVTIPLAKTTDEAELAFQSAERFAAVDRAQAVAAYEQAGKLRAGYVDAYIGLARIHAETGEIDKAEKAIASARRAKPGLAEISAVEGRILKGVGEETKAIAAFKRAIKEGGGFQPEAYAGLGILYKEKAEGFGADGEYAKEAANYTEAAKHLNLAIKQLSGAPDAVVLYQLLGLTYEQQKQPAKAIAVYQEFLKFFPGHPEAEAFQSFITQLQKQGSQPE